MTDDLIDQHTPAPWAWKDRYEDQHGKGEMLLSNNGKGTYICHLYWQVEGRAKQTTDKWQAERKANMRLIAAAPDLLEALRGVIRVADRKTDEFDAAHAAVAKAEGNAR